MTPPQGATTAPARLSALANHLTPTSPPPTASEPPVNMSTPAETKPPITCHVLDTTIGRPGASIPVTLTLHNPSSTLIASSGDVLSFTSTTNSDGRVTSWTPSPSSSSSSSTTAQEDLATIFRTSAGDQKWSLRFDTQAYYAEKGVDAFFYEVEVKFVVAEKQRGGNGGDGKAEHFHVPVLLGPFGYTTYRGS